MTFDFVEKASPKVWVCWSCDKEFLAAGPDFKTADRQGLKEYNRKKLTCCRFLREYGELNPGAFPRLLRIADELRDIAEGKLVEVDE